MRKKRNMKIDITDWSKEEQLDYYKWLSIMNYNNMIGMFFLFGMALFWFTEIGLATIIFFISAISSSVLNYKYKKSGVFETIRRKIPSRADRLWLNLKNRILLLIAAVICLILIIRLCI